MLASAMAVECLRCCTVLNKEDWAASISGSILGDEHTDTYFRCAGCGFYTVVADWDDFTGVETTTVSGPLAGAEGDERVRLIRQCAQPWDKQCRCPAHRAYFHNTLD